MYLEYCLCEFSAQTAGPCGHGLVSLNPLRDAHQHTQDLLPATQPNTNIYTLKQRTINIIKRKINLTFRLLLYFSIPLYTALNRGDVFSLVFFILTMSFDPD